MRKLSEAPDDVQLLAVEWDLWRQFNLNPGDLVTVAGSYCGKVMDLLLTVFPGVHVIGFEPQQWAWSNSIGRLEAHQSSSWEAYPFGLGTESGIFPMGEYHTDACSFINTESREQTTGRIYEYGHIKERCFLDKVALFICNMEGYEFNLIPYLAAEGHLPSIKAMAIQWHPNIAPAFTVDLEAEIIDSLVPQGYQLVVDERPAWTYHVRP